MKQFKLTFLLILLMSMMGIEATAHDIEVKNSDGVTIYYKWANNGTKLSVSYRGVYSDSYSNEYTGNVVIPESVIYNGNTYSVTSIGGNAFRGCSGLTSVTIGNSVTSIGDAAFYNCSGLTSVTIPNSVTSIGSSAFRNCSGLTSVTIPNSVTSIGGSAFYGTALYNNVANGVYYVDRWVCGYKGDKPTGNLVLAEDSRGIGNEAFYGCSDLTNVTVPNSVTSIGNDAFNNCYGMKNVTIGNSVTSIGSSAFYYCSSLTSVTIPTSVASIGSSAFSGCSGLTNVTIPNSVTSIGKNAFSGCSRLTSVTIPNSITSIGESAFSGCSGLTEVNYNATYCTSMGSSSNPVFANCSSLTTISIGDNVQNIPAYAFYDCSGLTSVTIPNSVTSIGGSAFYNCSGLTSVNVPVTDISTFCNNQIVNMIRQYIGKPVHLIDEEGNEIKELIIPDDVTSIGSYAFYNCSGLQSVVVGNGVTNIHDYAFGTGSNIKSFTVGSGVLSISLAFNKKNNNISSSTYSPIKTIWLTNTPPEGYKYAAGTINYVANNLYTSLSNTTEYKFLSSLFEVDGVKYVPVSPSERTCDAIDCLYDERAENVNIGETVSFKGVQMTVQRVHQYACYFNPFIKKVELNLNGNVEDYAFYKNENLNTVEVGSHVANIGASVFMDCVALSSAQLKNKGDIGKQAFLNCTNMATSTIMNEGNIDAQAFQGCSAMTTAKLGEAVTGIDSEAFRGCSSLQNIVIPNAVTKLGQSAFRGCSRMTSVKMGTGVKTIRTYAFADCSALTSMQIGSKVESIETNVFYNCKALPIIEIPKSVKTINNYVFSGCSGLKDVVIADRDTILTLGSNGSSPLFSDCPLDSVYIGGNINYNTSSDYGYSPFYRNTSLRTVVITDKETEISENEFYGCTNLQDVKIGDGVESFGDWAFSGCSSLKHFAFGMSVEQIGKEAFSDCTAMESIASRSPEPPVCGSQALDDINKWNCVLTVPAGNKAAYMAADQWKEFFFIEEVSSDIPELKVVQQGQVRIYSPNGKLLDRLQKGLNIVVMQDGTTRKVVVR